MITYTAKGRLTDYIDGFDNVKLAQEYLADDDMTQYLDGDLKAKVSKIYWELKGDGYNYSIIVQANGLLTEDELKKLSGWCLGQNSDGLGEGFEQQDFAWRGSDLDECECEDEDFECSCGYDEGGMISFDWKTNKLAFAQEEQS